MKNKTILLVEDDTALRIGLSFDLEAEGYEVIGAGNCKEAREAMEQKDFQMAIFDGNLPDGDGFTLCRELKVLKDVPVMFLTARDLISDQVKGFDAGADDYVTKPFSNILLRKRVEAILKRASGSKKSKVYEDGYLYVDFDNFISKKEDISIALTPTEFKLLQVLMVNGGSVVTRQMILEKLWDNNGNFVDEHALTVNINRVRSKIEAKDHKYIKTVYGLGYTWIGERFE